MSGADRLLDLRGMRCPWPALRVARALREGDAPVMAVADDPIAPAEIGAVAAAHGWAVEPATSAIGPGLRLRSNSGDSSPVGARPGGLR